MRWPYREGFINGFELQIFQFLIDLGTTGWGHRYEYTHFQQLRMVNTTEEFIVKRKCCFVEVRFIDSSYCN